jgi:hypothetical protein
VSEDRSTLIGKHERERFPPTGEVNQLHSVDRLFQLSVEVIDPKLVEVA